MCIPEEDDPITYLVDFERVVRQRTLQQVFGGIESWLHDQNARVKESLPPVRIVANHGRLLHAVQWAKNARKQIAFFLEPDGADVRVRVRITPGVLNAGAVGALPDEARANWTDLLAGLWERFDEPGMPAESVSAPQIDSKASVRAGKIAILVGGFMVALTALVFLAFFQHPAVATGLGLGFASGGAYTLLKGRSLVQSARRRLVAEKRKVDP